MNNIQNNQNQWIKFSNLLSYNNNNDNNNIYYYTVIEKIE